MTEGDDKVKDSRESPVQYVDKILDVIEQLSQAESPLGLTELGRRSNINKTTVYRILTALQQRFYIQQTNDLKYKLGPAWHQIGIASGGETSSAMARIRQTLVPLLNAHNETVHLSVYLPLGRAVYIDVLESRQALRTSSRIGTIAPAYCISTGKALLAHQRPEEITAVLQSMHSFTNHTIKNPENMLTHLREIRSLGYSINRQEYQAEVCGVAIPLFSSHGEVFAAIGYCVPAIRFTDTRVADMVDTLNTYLSDFLYPKSLSLSI